MAYPDTSIAARQDWEGGSCVLTYEPLDTDAIIRSVRDDNAGATAVFIGTTRNSFKGITTWYMPGCGHRHSQQTHRQGGDTLRISSLQQAGH